jgi:C-terminal peptidase prc
MRQRVRRIRIRALRLVFSGLVFTTSFNSAVHAGYNVEFFVTGNEQTIIDRFVTKRDELAAGRFSNSLDHAFAVLMAKAYPKPDALRLSRAAIASLSEQSARQGGSRIDAAQSDRWVSETSRTGRFDAVLKELTARDNRQTNHQPMIEAALNAMLKASGWDAACVLDSAQANAIERMAKARATPTEERGILGLKLDHWPAVAIVADAPAAEAGIKNNDVVLAINGKDLKDLADVKNAADALRLLEGRAGEKVNLKVSREAGTFEFEITRASAATAMISWRKIKPNALLISIRTFEGSGIAARVKQLIDAKATNSASIVVLDLRDNGGGRPEEANGVADLFLDSKRLQICQFRDSRSIAFKSHPDEVAVRIILLTNHSTGSAAEMLAMALRDNGRGIIVGEATAGALFGKDVAKLTSGETIMFRTEPTVLSPTGRDYSTGGIPPDVKVGDLRGAETDAILARALDIATRDTRINP